MGGGRPLSDPWLQSTGRGRSGLKCNHPLAERESSAPECRATQATSSLTGIRTARPILIGRKSPSAMNSYTVLRLNPSRSAASGMRTRSRSFVSSAIGCFSRCWDVLLPVWTMADARNTQFTSGLHPDRNPWAADTSGLHPGAVYMPKRQPGSTVSNDPFIAYLPVAAGGYRWERDASDGEGGDEPPTARLIPIDPADRRRAPQSAGSYQPLAFDGLHRSFARVPPTA